MNKEIVIYIRKNAESPIFRDSIIKHRKILLLGKKYFYMDNKSYDIPPILYDFIKKEKLEKFNSILINVYNNRKDFIGWHMDDIKILQEGKIISYSFAINNEDINKTLAIMEFRENNIITKIKLKHGTKIEFNAFNDYKLKRFHRIPKTMYPRTVYFKIINSVYYFEMLSRDDMK